MSNDTYRCGGQEKSYRNIKRAAALLAGLALAGCAAGPPQSRNEELIVPPPPPKGLVAENAKTNFQIVRYIGIDTSAWPGAQAAQNYSDLYTRMELSSPNSAGTAATGSALRDYNSENRDWFARLWSSETDTVTAVANITVRDPGLTVAIPLFSVSHASGRDLGNSWVTNFTASSVESPLFRIGPNTGLTIHVAAKISSDLKSQGASLAVGAVTKAVQIAAPTSTLLTTLSQTEVNNAASAIDTAISSLLSEDIGEDIEVGRLMNSWTGSAAISLSGCAPFVRSTDPVATGNCAANPDTDGGTDMPVGTWQLQLACPRISAFDPRDVCDVDSKTGALTLEDISTPTKLQALQASAANTVSDAQVLGFNLSSQVNILTFVQSQSWFTTFMGVTGTKQAKNYDDFCNGALVGMEMNGLNKFDAALVIRAIANQMPQLTAVKAAFATSDGANCKKLLSDAGVTV